MMPLLTKGDKPLGKIGGFHDEEQFTHVPQMIFLLRMPIR